MARIAFLSTAHIHTRSFINSIVQAGDGRRTVAVWDDVPSRGRQYAAMAGAPFVENLDDVLRDPLVDGFAICAENTRHRPLLEKALLVGKPIFCEKPLVTTLEDLAAVRDLWRRHPAPLICGYFMPFEPPLQAVRRILAEGQLGRITRVRYRCAHHAAYGRWFDSPDLHWFTDPRLAGGGALMDLGTHAVHALRTLFGPVRRVWARTANESDAYPEVDDAGIAHLEFASGIWGTVEASWTQTGGPEGLEVVAAAGAIWKQGDAYLLGSPEKPAVPLPEAPALPARIDRLVAAVRGEIAAAELEADLDAACGSTAILAAAYHSAHSGRWENVETPR